MQGIRRFAIVIGLAFGIVAAPAFSTMADDATPAASPSVVKVVLASSEPTEAPGEQLSLARYTIPAGAVLPVHRHPGDQMATVISGTLTYHVVANGSVKVTRANGTLETINPGQTVIFNVGDSWVEPEGMVHYAENKTDQPVVLMSAALFAENQSPTILVNVATPTP